MPLVSSQGSQNPTIYTAPKAHKSTAARANWHSTHSTVVGAIFKGIYNAFVERFFSSPGEYKERLHIIVGEKHALSDKYHRYDFACKSRLRPLESSKYQEVIVDSIENRDFRYNKGVFVSVPSVAKRLNVPIKEARRILKNGELNDLLTHKYNTFRNEVHVLAIKFQDVSKNIDEVKLVQRNNNNPKKKRFGVAAMNAISKRSEVYADWMKSVIGAYKEDEESKKLSHADEKKIENICKEIAWLEATAKKSKKHPESIDRFGSETDKQIQNMMTYVLGCPDLVDEMHNAYRTHKEEKKAAANSIKV